MTMRPGVMASSGVDMTMPASAGLETAAPRLTVWRWCLRKIHRLRAVLFFAVVGSGFLLFSPTLRSEVTGGYSLSVEQVHLFLGLFFALLCVVPFGSRTSRSHAEPGRPPKRPSRLRMVRRVVAGGVAVLLLATGFAVWFNLSLPLAVVDAADNMHLWLTYAACLVVAIHIYEASRASAQRRRARAASVASLNSEAAILAKAASGS